jgi:hypothetical protein
MKNIEKKENNISKILSSIDKKATEKLIEGFKNNTVTKPIVSCRDGKLSVNIDKPNIENSIDILKIIMADSCTEFEKKTGRKMTYFEMREAFG